MSTPADYLTFLNRNGVKLWVDNGELRYHAKKGVLSSEELARLRSMRSEIVAELTKAATSAASNTNRAHAVSVVEGPVSFQQRWSLKLLEEHPDWRATLSYVFHLQGALDSAALERSFEGVLRTHASLRTKIVCVCGEWRQQIAPGERFQLPITQVSGNVEADKQKNVWFVLRNIEARELDPVVGPVMTAQLVRVSAQEHFLVVLIHRLATDCLGMGQVSRDLWILYAQMMQKGCSTSLERPTQYRDYALWQQTTDAAWRQKHAAYWNDYLAGAECIRWRPNICAPPTSRSGPGTLASLESPFGETLSAGLRELSRQTRTLPALIMLSVYVGCASTGCGQKDLVMPFVIAGRRAVHEGVVGCFSHLVYLRIRLRGSENFLELLKLVSNEFYRVAAFRQDSGRAVTQRSELLRGTLCQWLSWHPADIAQPQTDGQTSLLGLKVETVRCQSLEELTNVPPDRVDLEMNFFDAGDEISALAIYRTGRLAEGATVQLMREVRAAAERAVRDSSAPVWGQGAA